jgi:hypothetical protein
VSEVKAQAEANFHIHYLVFYADDLVKPCSFVWVVRRWHDICTEPILKCFDNLEGLSCGNLLVVVVLELANGLSLCTIVPS